MIHSMRRGDGSRFEHEADDRFLDGASEEGTEREDGDGVTTPLEAMEREQDREKNMQKFVWRLKFERGHEACRTAVAYGRRCVMVRGASVVLRWEGWT